MRKRPLTLNCMDGQPDTRGAADRPFGVRKRVTATLTNSSFTHREQSFNVQSVEAKVQIIRGLQLVSPLSRRTGVSD